MRMIRLQVFLLFTAVAGCNYQVKVSGHSQPARPYDLIATVRGTESPTPVAGLPANIDLTSRSFEEPSGNRALDAEEEGALLLQLRNDGLGAGSVVVRLTPVASLDHIVFSRSVRVGILNVGESVTVRIPIAADINVTDGTQELRVEVIEEYNHATIPFVLSFETRRLVAPEFRVIVRDADDGHFFSGNTNDGLIQAGEMVQVVANVQNVGGLGEHVEVQIEVMGEGVSYARDLDGSPDTSFRLGEMTRGESRDVGFFFFTTPVFAGPNVTIVVNVREARGRFGKQDTLSFAIGGSVTTEEVLAVQATQLPSGPLEFVETALVDIEDVPQDSRTHLEDGIAIIYGIEEYRHTFPATYKNRDAAYFYRYCREVLRIPEERIYLRTDSDATKGDFDYVFEPRATTNQGWLKKRLRDPAEAAKADVFVYLAGHGFPDLATNQPYLIPYDIRPEQASNGLQLERLYETLSEFGARSVTVFVESCFSGASGYDRGGKEQLLALNMNPVFPVMEQPMIGPRTVVFAATSGKSPSSNRDDLKHGIFTYFVLKGLGGAADSDGDKAVTVAELFRYLEKEVPRKALEPPLDREQIPQLLPSIGALGERDRILVRY
jgi:hypothetical protein